MTCTWSSGYVSDVEYLPGLYVEQAPGHVILTCLLNGIAPPRLGGDFTYCELGCGQGVTAIVIAAANPTIQVVATDFNPAHIARARDAAQTAGIGNVTFLELSFADMADGQGLPDFDMVTLHGVWSWIGAADRANIAAFLARRLKPGGAVSLSYNAMPGWTALLPMQRLLASQASLLQGRSDERVLQALEFARRVQDAGSGVVGGPALLDQIRTGSGKVAATDRAVYLAHEYLNANWQPQYHMDTAGLLADAKLAFVGSAALMENFPDLMLKPAQRAVLDDVPPGPYRETLKDYMVNRPFRRDVFVRGARRLSDRERDRQLEPFGLVLTAVRGACRLTLDVPVGSAQLPARHYEPILDALAVRPHTLGELRALPALKDDPAAPSMVEMAGILIGSGQALAVPSGLSPAPSATTRRLNHAAARAVAEQRAAVAEMASPLTGSGTTLTTVEALVFDALAHGRPRDEAALLAHIAPTLMASNTPLMRDGKVIAEPHERLETVREAVGWSLQNRVHLWEAMGLL
ncbi:class I SAM-dependent methyltransferase [Aquabacter sp. L1I39]|uniref:class I SAM-dependent methyltransferase n=1 Tax=Aquabacter sp. L1I39 TaxID=2820278 RepID=UPI001ADB88BB|nr:class I SAM-dependent methyltransferase [Aquabacter sp. L1I39]QTL01697.1 class I SAM-dependent methyltransferase [Aquabacter sp. L1I39]